MNEASAQTPRQEETLDPIIVLKFGGTSVKNLARMQHVSEVIAACAPKKCVVVVSAMGDTTDFLLSLAGRCAEIPDKRELDVLLSTGEQVSIALLALRLRSMGIKAKSFTGYQIGLRTDGEHTAARILEIDESRLKRELIDNDVLVVAGFQGMTTSGDISTLGRGGSDTSAVAVALACGASECHIYTDVDGICTADPSVVPNAFVQTSMAYEEALELARSGAQVIHPRAVELAHQYGMALRIRNTFNPDHEGTLLQESESMENFGIVRGVALDKTQLSIELFAVPKHYSILNEISALPDFNELCIDSIVETESQECGCKNVCLLVRCANQENVLRIALALKSRIEAERISIDTDVVRLSAVGRGLTGQPEFTLRFARALTGEGVDLKHLTCSDNRITGVVAAADGERACNALHAEFFSRLDGSPKQMDLGIFAGQKLPVAVGA